MSDNLNKPTELNIDKSPTLDAAVAAKNRASEAIFTALSNFESEMNSYIAVKSIRIKRDKLGYISDVLIIAPLPE
jgi:hypothetical protein